MEGQLGQFRFDLDTTHKNVPIPDRNLPELGKAVVLSGGWAVVSIIVGLIYLLTPPNIFPGVDLVKLMPALSGNLDFLVVDLNSIFLLLGALFVFSTITIILALIKKVSPLQSIGAGLALILFISLPKTTESILMINGVGGDITILNTLVISCLAFMFLTGRILSRVRQSFEKLKPYHAWLPSLGCFGNLFGLFLCLLPALYGLYAFSIFSGQIALMNMVATDYAIYILTANAFLFFIIGLILVGYTLLAWKTSQTIETRFNQAVFQRAQKMEQLGRQIKSLEQALSHIKLRSQ